MTDRKPPLDIVFLEPYDGGSHRDFREGLARHSHHRLRAFTLPPRSWKWRMRGAAVWFAERLNADPGPCDLILATSLLNLADLRGLLRRPLDRVPLVLYMHENQLTYPLSPRERFDFHFGFTSIVSALAADHVVFNSDFHREGFLDAVPEHLGRMPGAVPRGVRERLDARSSVLPVGLSREPHGQPPRWLGSPGAAGDARPWPRDGRRPLLVWNHRWEFDKRPEWFAAAVAALLDRELDFAVALLGDRRHDHAVFSPLAARLGDRCVQDGFLADRGAYQALLARGDVVVSCAAQENFGIAVAEAIHAGCYPVLPREQVYPSLYGTRCRGRHFYDGPGQLADLLAELIGGTRCGHVCSLASDCDAFCWSQLVPRYDALLDRVAATGGKEGPWPGDAT